MLAKEESSSGKESCSLTVHVGSHLSDFLLELATLVQTLPVWVVKNEYKTCFNRQDCLLGQL